VEATVKEFSGVFNHKGKLPYRGAFRTQVYAYCMAIGVNFGRVARQKRRKFGKSAAGARNLPPTAAKHYQKMLNFTFSLTKGFFERSKIYFTQFFFSGWSYPWLGEHAK